MAEKEKVIGRVKVKDLRLSFADHLFSPDVKIAEKGKKKGQEIRVWNCNFLVDKSDKDNIRVINSGMREAAKHKWGDNIPKIKADRLAFRDGDEETWDGYEGHMYISCNSYRQPDIYGRNPKLGKLTDDGTIYAGCYVNAIVTFWAQDDEEYGKRINCSLEGVQFVRDGEAFARSGVSEDDFDQLDDDEPGLASGFEDDDDEGGSGMGFLD